MGDITIRNLDESLIQALEQRASSAGRSLEEEVLRILSETVQSPQDAFWERMRQRRASYGDKVFSDSGAISSEMRAERSGLGGDP